MTRVQMMSERVQLVVEKLPKVNPEKRGLAAGYMIGRVEAIFVMRNQGTQEESFDIFHCDVHAEAGRRWESLLWRSGDWGVTTQRLVGEPNLEETPETGGNGVVRAHGATETRHVCKKGRK